MYSKNRADVVGIPKPCLLSFLWLTLFPGIHGSLGCPCLSRLLNLSISTLNHTSSLSLPSFTTLLFNPYLYHLFAFNLKPFYSYNFLRASIFISRRDECSATYMVSSFKNIFFNERITYVCQNNFKLIHRWLLLVIKPYKCTNKLF